MNPRNILILIGLAVAVIIGFVVIGNLLNALVPLAITAVVAFILGRLSVHFNLLDFIRSARAGIAQAAPQQQAGVMKTAESLLGKAVPAAKPNAPAAQPPPAAKAEVAPAPAEPQVKNRELLDTSFEIKTPEQIEAEARQCEQEIAKRVAGGSGDVNSALEERRKRLLGNKGEGG